MTHRVSILAVPSVQTLDVAGPMDVFAEANRLLGRDAYASRIVGLSNEPVVSASGMRLLPDEGIGESRDRPNTFLVAGAPEMPRMRFSADATIWMRNTAAQATRYGSVCSGAFALAAAGLLDGRRATTHWRVADLLRRRHPEVIVEADRLYVADGPVRTSGGVTAGIDLALALVEEDHGRVLALEIASHLVLFFRRPGGQAQYRRSEAGEVASLDAIADLQRYAVAHPEADLSVRALAGRLDLSPRHFARLFKTSAGVTPMEYVESVRVDAARRQLETTNDPLKIVAAVCGFGDQNRLRRAFVRRLSSTPGEYRRRFSPRRPDAQ